MKEQAVESLGKITVIVPVYNAERFLRRSVGSILSQTYPDLEVLLINDGSKDNSLSLCRELAKKDARITVFDQPNGGAAAARNTGLRAITGDYVMMADADDFLVPNACEAMIRAIQGHDLAIAHFYFDLGAISTPKGLLNGDRTMEEPEYLDRLLRRPNCFYFCALWNKLYRADIIRKNALTFDPFYDWGEDFVFNIQYAHFVHRVALVEQPIYHYVKVAGSTSMRWVLHIPHSIRVKYGMYRHFRDLCAEKGLYPQHRWKVDRFIFSVTVSE